MADAELKEKKFGYVVQPPPPPHCHHHPPFHGAIPPGMTVQDWTTYINSYIDVRARQLYDKLKGLVQPTSVSNPVHPYLLLRDLENENVYRVYIRNGILCSDLFGTSDGQGGYVPLEWTDETTKEVTELIKNIE